MHVEYKVCMLLGDEGYMTPDHNRPGRSILVFTIFEHYLIGRFLGDQVRMNLDAHLFYTFIYI